MTSYPSTSAQEVTFPTLASIGTVKPVLSKSQRMCEIYEAAKASGDLDELPARAVARKYGVSHNTTLRWQKQLPYLWEKFLMDGFKPSNSDRIRMHGGAGIVPVKQIAEELGIDDSTVYRYMKRNKIKKMKVDIPMFSEIELTFVESMMMKWK